MAPESSTRADADEARRPRTGLALFAIALAQLTVVLDGTIVAVALPQIQSGLGLADTDRQWVVSAYALAFGALLLLGGRLADYGGRKKAVIIGMAGFAIASALGGLAQGMLELMIARVGQGVFAALLAPAALSILTVTFTEPKARARAFAVFGAVSAGGAAVGLVLGGFLTEFLDWRWSFWVNVPIAALVITLGGIGLRESTRDGKQALDVAGAIIVAIGLSSIVFGFAEAERGWTQSLAIPALILGVLFLAAFALVEARHRAPLLPLSILASRRRATAFIGLMLTGGALVGGILQLMLYLQVSLGLAPLPAGLGILPLTAGIAVSGATVGKILPTVGMRWMTVTGAAIAALGFAGLSFIPDASAYFTTVLPWLFLVGVGLGATMIPLQSGALTGVASSDAGAASALVNATQQIGGAVGTAVLSAVAAGAASAAGSAVAGYSGAFVGSAITLAVFAVVALVLIRRGTSESADALEALPIIHA